HITHDYPDAAGANQGKKISTVSDYFKNIRTHSVHPRVSVGYDFGGWRIAADYARYRKWKESNSSTNTENSENQHNRIKIETGHQGNGSFHAASSLGLSAVYDFKLNDKFKPYIGARVAYGHVRHQVNSVDKETITLISKPKGMSPGGGRVVSNLPSKPAYYQSNSISSLGFGAVAGVGIDITPNLTLDAGYRYHNWGRLENTRFKTHEASLGVRYRF
ncbi:outer membrane beta-barrel protein, partial [Neisseria gonorrhoeae]